MKTSNKISKFILVLFLIFQLNELVHASQNNDFRLILGQIKDAVSKNNPALALSLISKATKILDDVKPRPIITEEALRWDIAQLNLDRSDSMPNTQQMIFFANESIKKWNEYIQWYSKLNAEELRIIQSNPESFRIQRAVNQLGNAYIRRGNVKEYNIQDMFSTFSDLPYTHLSTKSIKLWEKWLFRCPSWKTYSARSYKKLKVRFSSTDNLCIEDWIDFHSYLEDWLENQKLSVSSRKKYKRIYIELSNSLGTL